MDAVSGVIPVGTGRRHVRQPVLPALPADGAGDGVGKAQRACPAMGLAVVRHFALKNVVHGARIMLNGNRCPVKE
jgi:hypothetical protein